jgi:1-phosphofructokinase
MADRPPDEPRVAVFAPSPVLVCTFEYPHDDSDPEVALNVGGQGPWVARAVSALGARAMLVVPLGGETGRTARHLLSDAPHDTRVVATQAAVACYVEERRHGERSCIREAPPGRFGEREIDDIYSAALAAGLESDVCVITGSPWPDQVDRTLLTRLTADLARLGRTTVVDLSGEQLDAALAGGVDWVKVSHEQLRDIHGVADDEDALWEAAADLARATGSPGRDGRGADQAQVEGEGEVEGEVRDGATGVRGVPPWARRVGAEGGGLAGTSGASRGGGPAEASGANEGSGTGETRRPAEASGPGAAGGGLAGTSGSDTGEGRGAGEGADAGDGRRRSVVVSRAGSEPTLVLAGDTRYRVAAPRMTTVDSRGSGDAMTAALAAGLAAHQPIEDLLRRAAAAGAANAVHKGSATPDRDLVDRLAGTVQIDVV